MPSTSAVRKSRNQILECCKLCAAILIVFFHYPFPGGYGGALSTLSLVAVPFFFVISGYYSYEVEQSAIQKRMAYVFKLNLIASLIYMLSNWFFAVYNGVPFEEYRYWDSVFPRMPAILRWVTQHFNPFSEHLWYLAALYFCYLYLWGYLAIHKEKPTNYHSLYIAGLIPLFVLIFFGSIAPDAGFSLPYHTYRNGWVYGPAMFMIGIFLHEYQEKLIQELKLNNSKLLAIFTLGVILALSSWRTKSLAELPLGTLIQVPALLLLCVCNPKYPDSQSGMTGWGNRLISKLGPLYTAIYILHMAIGRVYSTFLHSLIETYFGPLASWLMPILILALTLLAAWIWVCIETIWRKKSG